MRLTVDINFGDAWNEAEHPRSSAGKFAAAHGASEGENEPLTPAERQEGHRRLDEIQERPHPWEKDAPNPQITVHPADIGFKRPDTMFLGGAKHTGRGWATVKKVPIKSVNYSQTWVPKEGVSTYIDNINKNPELPELAHGWGEDGEYHVISGHTRLSAQALAGRKHILAKIYHFKPKSGEWIDRRDALVQVRAPK